MADKDSKDSIHSKDSKTVVTGVNGVNGNMRELRVQLESRQMKLLGHRCVELELSQKELVVHWIECGMPMRPEVKSLGTSEEFDSKIEEIFGGQKKVAEERDSLKKRVDELEAQLKLATKKSVEATPRDWEEREKELLERVCAAEGRERELLERVAVLEKNERVLIEASTQLQAENDRLTGLLAKQPVAGPAKAAVSDFDQSPEAEEQRKVPVVAPGLLPNGLPPGKTMGADGKPVDAEEAGF